MVRYLLKITLLLGVISYIISWIFDSDFNPVQEALKSFFLGLILSGSEYFRIKYNLEKVGIKTIDKKTLNSSINRTLALDPDHKLTLDILQNKLSNAIGFQNHDVVLQNNSIIVSTNNIFGKEKNLITISFEEGNHLKITSSNGGNNTMLHLLSYVTLNQLMNTVEETLESSINRQGRFEKVTS